jgi:hypothetical protein
LLIIDGLYKISSSGIYIAIDKFISINVYAIDIKAYKIDEMMVLLYGINHADALAITEPLTAYF